MQKMLLQAKQAGIYGICFDFASDRIREESEPILNEIAGVLTRNPSWVLNINGHRTELAATRAISTFSDRRSEAVRAALVARGITAERLFNTGFG